MSALPTAADVYAWERLTWARIITVHRPSNLARLMRADNDNGGKAA